VRFAWTSPRSREPSRNSRRVASRPRPKPWVPRVGASERPGVSGPPVRVRRRLRCFVDPEAWRARVASALDREHRENSGFPSAWSSRLARVAVADGLERDARGSSSLAMPSGLGRPVGSVVEDRGRVSVTKFGRRGGAPQGRPGSPSSSTAESREKHLCSSSLVFKKTRAPSCSIPVDPCRGSPATSERREALLPWLSLHIVPPKRSDVRRASRRGSQGLGSRLEGAPRTTNHHLSREMMRRCPASHLSRRATRC
jgi:hypothetical protein